jgi:hypothetical protein
MNLPILNALTTKAAAGIVTFFNFIVVTGLTIYTAIMNLF